MASLVITSRQRHRIVGTALVALVALVVLVAAPDRDGAESEATSGLPTATIELFDGGDTTLADFDGTPLVINFWASWCPACVGELPEFQAVHQELGDDVAFLGVANSDQRGPAVALADDIGLTYTLADDPDGELFRELGLFAMPTTIFVTADGEVREVFGGALDEDGLRSRIDAIGAES